jgi:hypothetical protein
VGTTLNTAIHLILAPHSPALTPPPHPHPSQDLFQHNAWTVRVAGYQAADAERLKKVDFSAFYKKFDGN